MVPASTRVLVAFATVLCCLGCGDSAEVTLQGQEVVTFRVEVAESAIARAKGLMFRDTLPVDAGMLFVYPEAGPRAFWMKYTRIPLDILFLDGEGRVLNVAEAEPCTSSPCKRYVSAGRARYVLEINRGLSRRHGFGPGTPAEIRRRKEARGTDGAAP